MHGSSDGLRGLPMSREPSLPGGDDIAAAAGVVAGHAAAEDQEPPDLTSLPIPPLAMRELVGRPDPVAFDNPTGALVFPDLMRELVERPDPAVFDNPSGGLDSGAYASVFDFGCGC